MTIALIIGLMVVGLSLIAVEVLVIPGFGIPGVLGVAAGIGAGYLAVTSLPSAYAGLTIAAGVVAAGGMFWYFPRTQMAKAMVLTTETRGSSAPARLAALAGLDGTTLTPLRPSGTAELAGEAVDVISDGEYIDANTPIRVIQVSGSRVVVQARQDNNDPAAKGTPL